MKSKTVWTVCHIDNKHYETIVSDLLKEGYEDIRVYVPTISLLKKRAKGKDVYEDVPMLFSYGFIRMSVERAYSRSFLNKLKRDITGIHSWVKSLEPMHKKRLKKRTDNPEDWDDFSIVATVPRSEIRKFKKISKYNKVYSKYDIAQLEVGAYVVLRGYPFDGIQALVKDISLVRQEVKVTLFPQGGTIEVWLPFDNALYSVYYDYDPDKFAYEHAEDHVNNQYKLTTEQEEPI